MATQRSKSLSIAWNFDFHSCCPSFFFTSCSSCELNSFWDVRTRCIDANPWSSSSSGHRNDGGRSDGRGIPKLVNERGEETELAERVGFGLLAAGVY